MPRQQIVLPKAEEKTKSSSSSDHAQKARMSAACATVALSSCFSSNLLIIRWRRIAWKSWLAKNTMGTAIQVAAQAEPPGSWGAYAGNDKLPPAELEELWPCCGFV